MGLDLDRHHDLHLLMLSVSKQIRQATMIKFGGAIFFVISMFVWSGCYDTVQITGDQVGQLDGYQDITAVVDTQGTVSSYHFARGMYRVVRDTLVGTGTTTTMMGELTQSGISIPSSRIAYVEVDKLNMPRTLLLAGGVVAATTAMVLSAASNSGSPGSSGSGPQPPR